MFGAGMPVLFPIALCQFFVLYVMEKVLLVYSYRQPIAMLDEKLNQTAIKLMLIAPFFYCLTGYWMYDNEQLFGNYKLIPTSTFGESMRTGHSILNSIAVLSKQSFMFLPFLALLFISAVFQRCLLKYFGIQN
jgi:hypothetical protein